MFMEVEAFGDNFSNGGLNPKLFLEKTRTVLSGAAVTLVHLLMHKAKSRTNLLESTTFAKKKGKVLG